MVGKGVRAGGEGEGEKDGQTHMQRVLNDIEGSGLAATSSVAYGHVGLAGLSDLLLSIVGVVGDLEARS